MGRYFREALTPVKQPPLKGPDRLYAKWWVVANASGNRQATTEPTVRIIEPAINIPQDAEPETPAVTLQPASAFLPQVGMFEPQKFEPENLPHTLDHPLIKKFYGKTNVAWLANRAADSDKFNAREAQIKAKRLARNPQMTPDNYDKIRNTELDEITKRAARKVDERFANTVQEVFDTKEPADQFVNRQYEHANSIVEDTRTTRFEESAALTPKNEAVLGTTAAEAVKRVNDPKTSEALRIEEVRRQILAFTTGEIESKNSRFDGQRKLSRIQAVLDENLYGGDHASTEYRLVRALFDNQTNDVLAVSGISYPTLKRKFIPKGTHIKSIGLQMRKIQGTDELVYTNPDVKTVKSSASKALRKAQDRQEKTGVDVIDPTTDVQDRYRMLIVVNGTQDAVDALVTKTFDILVDNQKKLSDDGDVQVTGREALEDIDDDSQTNGNSYQSKEARFRRIQVKFANPDEPPFPVEIKFQTMEQYLRDEFSVGTFDEKAGQYTGSAHALYNWNRSGNVARLLFSETVYKGMNFARESSRRLQKIREGLSKANRAA